MIFIKHFSSDMQTPSTRQLIITTLFIFCLALNSSRLLAQGDTVGYNYKRVLIIPYDPMMYFSDADHDLAKYNNKDVRDVREKFRYDLNYNVKMSVMTQYEARPLLTDSTRDAHIDLQKIYKSVTYKQEKSKPAAVSDDVKHVTGTADSWKDRFRFSKREEAGEAGKYNTDTEPQEYMNVVVHNKAMFTYLNKKYGTDLFLFLNQFEVITNYEHCLDRATNTFERTIKVHYSIYNYRGEQLAGDIALVNFPSNSNDLFEIIQSNFPTVAKHLAGDLPGRKEVKVKVEAADDELEYLKFEESVQN